MPTIKYKDKTYGASRMGYHNTDAVSDVADDDELPIFDKSANAYKKTLFSSLKSKFWGYVQSQLATVATSGSYNDLSNKPTIPSAQVQTDWNATSGMGSILHKPNLSTVATSGNYNDLSNQPTIDALTSGTRLGKYISNRVTSCNDVRTTGFFYIGAYDTARPSGIGTGGANTDYLLIANFYSDIWGSQIAQDFYTNRMWKRYLNSGYWGVWEEITESLKVGNSVNISVTSVGERQEVNCGLITTLDSNMQGKNVINAMVVNISSNALLVNAYTVGNYLYCRPSNASGSNCVFSIRFIYI